MMTGLNEIHWSIYIMKICLNRGFTFPSSPHCVSPSHPPSSLPWSSWALPTGLVHLSAVQNYLWPGLALFSKTATMPAPWMSLEGAAVPTVWPENSSCRYTSHQPCDTAHLPSAQRHPESKVPAPQEPLLPAYRLESKHFYCERGKKRVLSSWVSPAQFLKWSQRGFWKDSHHEQWTSLCITERKQWQDLWKSFSEKENLRGKRNN